MPTKRSTEKRGLPNCEFIHNSASSARDARQDAVMAKTRSSETRAEALTIELLTVRGWSVGKPPKGNVLWKNEYRNYPHIMEALKGTSKTGTGDGYPDFLVVTPDAHPLIVGETKADEANIALAIREACHPYAESFFDHGFKVLAAGIAGNEKGNIGVAVKKRGRRDWESIEYRQHPIQWLPTPEETEYLLRADEVFDLQPRVPSPAILAKRGEQINRILRESDIKDEYRPAVMGAFMLALWHSKGEIRTDAKHILKDINEECRQAFIAAGKSHLAFSIVVPEGNAKLAAKAAQICYILRLLNVTTLTAEHDYLGQLYETFFRFTGGNTIGQYFTPRHITKFVVDLCEVSESDVVIDPSCGTGGFLISALYKMMGNRHLNHKQMTELVKDHLKGFESEPTTAGLCVANMILRGDGTTGIVQGDCFTHPEYPKSEASVVVGNPPFPHEKTDVPAEKFVERGLEALKTRGILGMIVPSSLLVKKVKWREQILKENTLLASFTMPSDLFQPYATSTTSIILLQKGVPHNLARNVFFCQITNDGFELRKNVRVERPGEQLSIAIESYRNGRSIPRFCKHKSVRLAEWSPGAYLDNSGVTEFNIKHEIDGLIRQAVAFSALYGDKLYVMDSLVSQGKIQAVSYEQIKNASEPLDLDEEENSDAHEQSGEVIGKYFKLFYGQPELENKKGLRAGWIPVISSAGTDNGCYGFFDLKNVPIIKPPFVTAPRTGSIGEAFVQIWPCGVTSDCLIMVPKDGTTESDYYLAAAIIRLERWRFDYSRKLTPDRLAVIPMSFREQVKVWIQPRLDNAKKLISQIVSSLPADDYTDLVAYFDALVKQWTHETGHESVAKKVRHPAYLKIINLGEQALPLILRELKERPAHWFDALKSIAKETPVPTERRHDPKAVREAWLAWGQDKGLM